MLTIFLEFSNLRKLEFGVFKERMQVSRLDWGWGGAQWDPEARKPSCIYNVYLYVHVKYTFPNR